MTRGRVRLHLAAIAVVAVLLYGLAGHGLAQMGSHDGMAGATAGLCLLLVTVLGYMSAPKPTGHPVAVATHRVPAAVASSLLTQVDGRARASPSALQRFRN